MLTKNDITKLKNVFATKEELSTSVKQLIEYINTSHEHLRKEIKKDMQELKNDILQFKDEILHEINKIREDITVVVGYRDTIEDHEQRIQKIETKVN